MNPRLLVLAACIASGLALTIGIVIGRFALNNAATTRSQYERLIRQADPKNYRTFINSIQASNIEANLKDLTSRPHIAGLPEDLQSAEVIEQRWKKDGLEVTKPKYDVLLSYPDPNNPNKVILKDASGTTLVESEGVEHVYDSTQPKVVNPFLAYTPNGTVSSNKLFYANYGQLEDFRKLVELVGNASLQGSIIIMRYGQIYRGDKIMHAQYFGAVGAILYNDPIDDAPFGTTADQVYDQTWYMPPSGTQRGSAYIFDGDPLTPIYPSTNYMTRMKENTTGLLPKIPAQPIGYDEAARFFRYMVGMQVEAEWRGGLNVTYRYGGVFSGGYTMVLISRNQLEIKPTYNVIGMMKGDIEPDRYVLIGNHRDIIDDIEKHRCVSTFSDAWTLGALDPTGGTAIMLEMTRVLGEMYRNGFRPRRSLMFCSWGAEEYGLIGSVEYVEEYVKVLGARIVSYLNVDIAVQGTYQVDVAASPMLFDVIMEAAKMVPSVGDPPGTTIYSKWMSVKQNEITKEPKISYGLGSGSDFFAFDQLVGSSNFDASYMFNPAEKGNVSSYPLYHTSYEVFSMVKRFVDPLFLAHRAMGQFIGVLALILSESPVLPLNAKRYVSVLSETLNSLPANVSSYLGPLRSAINDFGTAVQAFVGRSNVMDTQNPYEIRMYNDQLLQLERAFLNPLGQGEGYRDMKHVVFAPAKFNQYASAGFPTITDAIANGSQEEIQNQIAIVTYFVRGALSTLKDFNKFIVT